MPKRAPLLVLRLVHLESQGFTRVEIAVQTGFPMTTVNSLLASPEATYIRKQLEARAIDTIQEVQADAQIAAPVMFKVMQDIALDDNEKGPTRLAAAKAVLEMAGHAPVKTVEIRRPNPLDSDYHNKTEDEIRKEIFEGLDDGSPRGLPSPNKSVH